MLWRTDEAGEPQTRERVESPAGQRVEHVRVGRHGSIMAATDTGQLYHWVYDDDEPAG